MTCKENPTEEKMISNGSAPKVVLRYGHSEGVFLRNDMVSSYLFLEAFEISSFTCHQWRIFEVYQGRLRKTLSIA